MELQEQLQKTLGDAYTVERELGGGGMSRVFLARDEVLGRPIVVKVLPSETAGAVSIERFKREIRLAASLQQANIVPVLSSGDAGGVPYYAMPFVKGESLRSRLVAKGKLPITECIAVMRDVARALAFAHQEGVVHRDIKPENILLSGGTAVVTDFGIAKAVAASSTEAAATLTQLGVAIGTPAYMAPEQAVGELVDHRADIYSLGVVAFEMLSGATPFAGRSAQATLAAHALEAPPSLKDKRPEAPVALTALIERCLSKEQAERPQSAMVVLEELELALTPSATAVPTIVLKPLVAVLPFANLSAAQDDEYFSEGIADDVIAQLSRIASMQVISRTSTMRHRNSGRASNEVARELGATHAVEGSVRRAGQRLRIVAQLSEANSGAILWAETFDRDLSDVFAIQSEVAQRVAEGLKAHLTPAERSRIDRPPTDNLEAYTQFLLGRRHWDKAGNPGAIEQAIECFTRAIELDPGFARAHGMLAQVWCWHAGGYFGVRPRDAGDLMMKHAAKSLELDPDGVEPQFCLAYLALWHRYDWRASESHLKRMFALNPSSVDARMLMAFHHASLGRMDEAVDVAKEACRLDPLSMNVRGHTILFLTWASRTDEAMVELRAVESELGDDFFLSWVRVFVMTALGRAAEIRDYLAQWKTRVPIPLAAINHGIALASAGEREGARRILEELESRRKQEYIWPVGLAWLSAELGDVDRGLAYLRQGFDDRAGLMNDVACAHSFDRFRGVPTFDAMVKAMGAVAPTTGAAGRRLEMLAAKSRATVEPTKREKASLVVLPFANMSPEQDAEFFSDGLTDELIADLSRIADLRVISRSSAMRLKGTTKSVSTIGRELGVQYVLQGGVRKAAKNLRITAQLTDASTDTQIWADKFSGTMDEIFAVQERVSRSIAQALGAKLSAAEEKTLAARPVRDPEAIVLYLRARSALWRGSGKEDALELIARAELIEPDNPALLGLRATALSFRLMIGRPDASLREQVAQCVRRLNALDPDSVHGHYASGWLAFEGGDLQRAADHFKKFVALEPANIDAMMSLLSAYVYAGRADAYRPFVARMLQIDPLHMLSWLFKGSAEWFDGEFDAAHRSLAKAVELFPEGLFPRWQWGYALALDGRLDESARQQELLERIDPESLYTIQLGALVDGCTGHRERGRERVASIDLAGLDGHVCFHLAESLAAVGAGDRALDFLQRAVDKNFYPNNQFITEFCPFFSAIRGDERFQRIAAEAKRRSDAFVV